MKDTRYISVVITIDSGVKGRDVNKQGRVGKTTES